MSDLLIQALNYIEQGEGDMATLCISAVLQGLLQGTQNVCYNANDHHFWLEDKQ